MKAKNSLFQVRQLSDGVNSHQSAQIDLLLQPWKGVLLVDRQAIVAAGIPARTVPNCRVKYDDITRVGDGIGYGAVS